MCNYLFTHYLMNLHIFNNFFVRTFHLQVIIAPLSDIPMFYIKYSTMQKVLVDYLPVHTHKPYNNLHVYNENSTQTFVLN